MTTKHIQELICKEEILKGNLPCENIQAPFFAGEQDVLSILKSGYTAEYEVKISRSDFKADAKKDKWKFYSLMIENKIPNYFSYACPVGLIKIDEVPEFAGLIYIDGNCLQVIKKAKIVHRHKPDLLKMITKMCRMKSERKYLGSCLLTYQNKLITERNRSTILL